MKMKHSQAANEQDIFAPLQHISRAQPRPYLATRALARMQQEQNPSAIERLVSLLTKPAFIIALVLIFIAVDYFAVQKNTIPVEPQGVFAEYASGNFSDYSSEVKYP